MMNQFHSLSIYFVAKNAELGSIADIIKKNFPDKNRNGGKQY